jgi:acid phosphatase family membrane protein YuiD
MVEVEAKSQSDDFIICKPYNHLAFFDGDRVREEWGKQADCLNCAKIEGLAFDLHPQGS